MFITNNNSRNLLLREILGKIDKNVLPLRDELVKAYKLTEVMIDHAKIQAFRGKLGKDEIYLALHFDGALEVYLGFNGLGKKFAGVYNKGIAGIGIARTYDAREWEVTVRMCTKSEFPVETIKQSSLKGDVIQYMLDKRVELDSK